MPSPSAYWRMSIYAILWVRVNNEERTRKKNIWKTRKITKQSNIYIYLYTIFAASSWGGWHFLWHIHSVCAARNAYILICICIYHRCWCRACVLPTVLQVLHSAHTVSNGSIVYTPWVETISTNILYVFQFLHNVTANTRVRIAHSQNTTCRLSMTVWLMKNWAVHTREQQNEMKWTRKKNLRKKREPLKILLQLLLFRVIKVDKFDAPINCRCCGTWAWVRTFFCTSLSLPLPLSVDARSGW